MIPLSGGGPGAQDYIEHVRPQMLEHPQERALFVNMSGERMSRQGFWKIIKHYQEKAEMKEITPHTCATPLRPICWKTGGSPLHPGDAGTRGHFVHSDLCPAGQPKLKDVYNKAHPRALD